MTSSTGGPQESPKFFEFDVGGRAFKFSKETLTGLDAQEPTNLFSRMVSDRIGHTDCFVDANPDYFAKWLDPYIRDNLLPKSIPDDQDKQIIVQMANKVGLHVLADYLMKPAVPPVPEMASGKKEFEGIGWKVPDEPPLPEDIESELDATCPVFKEEKVRESSVLQLIPETINDKPLTLNNLKKWIKELGIEGFELYIAEDIIKLYGDTPIGATYWVVMTKTVIPKPPIQPLLYYNEITNL